MATVAAARPPPIAARLTGGSRGGPPVAGPGRLALAPSPPQLISNTTPRIGHVAAHPIRRSAGRGGVPVLRAAIDAPPAAGTPAPTPPSPLGPWVGTLAQLGANPARWFAGYASLYGLLGSDTILATGLNTAVLNTRDPACAAGPDTSPLSQLNLSSCVPVTTQLISLIHSEMLKLS